MIAVIDYGIGNLGSIVNMLTKIGAETVVTQEPQIIEQADKLILPGVGTFDNGMNNLVKLGLMSLLTEKVIMKKTPVLGLCLGMQLFTQCSEEGKQPGLGWLEAETVRFKFNGANNRLKVPHMGWNTVKICRQNTLFAGMGDESRFYFVHSYHLFCRDTCQILTQTTHGYEFPSAVAKDNILGVQFHPEKSHKFGMKLLKNFVELF